jgi:thymidylate synthase
MKSRTVKSPAQGFRYIFSYILDHHTDFVSEDGDVSILGETICVHINEPMTEHVELINLSCQGMNSFTYYAEQLVEGKHIKKDNPEDEAEYTYYGRLFEYGQCCVYPDSPSCGAWVNQIQAVINKLKQSPNSRRGVAVTWQPWVDIDSHDPPCMDFLKFSIKNNKVCLTVVFRSHDVLKAWPQNVYGISYLLKYVADELGIEVGYLEVISCDPHVYIGADIDLVNKTKLKLKGV